MNAFRGVCVSIAVLDLLQVLLLGKGAGAVLGCLVYGGVAAAVVRWPPLAWVPVATVLLPTAILGGMLGMELRSTLVDAPMWGVYALQLVGALLGIDALFPGSRHASGRLG